MYVLQHFEPHTCITEIKERSEWFPVDAEDIMGEMKYSVAKNPKQSIPLIQNWLMGIYGKKEKSDKSSKKNQ